MEAFSPRANLFMTCKERYNLPMNCESLDRANRWIVYREVAQPQKY